MSKTSERRFRKLARGYADLVATGNVDKFRLAWEQRMRGWLYEIEQRMRQHQERAEPDVITTDETRRGMEHNPNPRIFDIFDSANRLLKACGEAVEQLVGDETRAVLSSECANAVACIYDKRLYQPLRKQLYKRIERP